MIIQISFNLEVPGDRIDDVKKILAHRIEKMPTFNGFTLPGGLQDVQILAAENEEEVEIVKHITKTDNH